MHESVAECVKNIVEKELGSIPFVVPIFDWAKKNPEEFANLLNEFNRIIQSMNDHLRMGLFTYPELQKLRSILGQELPPDIEDISYMYKQAAPHIIRMVHATLATMRWELSSGKMQLSDDLSMNPQKATQNLLIKGYALFTQYHHQTDNTVRAQFEKAFEEVRDTID